MGMIRLFKVLRGEGNLSIFNVKGNLKSIKVEVAVYSEIRW